MPILYGTGAAGITFETPFAKAGERLPQATAIDGEESFDYAAGFSIHWQRVEDQYTLPTEFRLRAGYLGELKLNDAYALKVGDSLARKFPGAFTPEDPQGEVLLAELYRALEKPKAPDYDCVAEKTCRRESQPPFQIWSWSKLRLVFSDENKTIVEIGLRRPRPVLPVAPLDILVGRLPGAFRLFDPRSSVHARLSPSAFVAESPTLSVEEWQGLALGFQPVLDGSDRRLRVFSLDLDYAGTLHAAGSPLEISPWTANFKMGDTLVAENPSAPVEAMATALRARAVEKTSYSEKLPILYAGKNRSELNAPTRATLLLAKPDFQSGRVIKLHYSPPNRRLNSIEVSALDARLDAGDLATVRQAATALDLTQPDRELGGRRLGEIAVYDEFSPEKGTARVRFLSTGERMLARVDATLFWEAPYPHFGRRRIPIHQLIVGQSLPVQLAMLPMPRTIDGKEQIALGVLGISTRYNPMGLRGLCGDPRLAAAPGDSESGFLRQFIGVTRDCPRSPRDGVNGREWEFPEMGVVLRFESGELTDTIIYDSPESIADTMEKAELR